MFREHKQEPIIYPNSFIDAAADFISRFHVLRRKPAAHFFALQISIETFCEVLIFAGVGDKAGIVLNKFKRADKGRNLFDDGGRDACLTKEDFRYVTLRGDDGINTN